MCHLVSNNKHGRDGVLFENNKTTNVKFEADTLR
jgi:hypothetical protein